MRSTATLDQVDLLFRAFADRTRVRILSLLSRWPELCVCDLIAVLKVPQAKVSRHLAYLRRAGLVRARKDGFWCHYSLLPARSGFHRQLLDCLASCFGEVPELLDDHATMKREKGPCPCPTLAAPCR